MPEKEREPSVDTPDNARLETQRSRFSLAVCVKPAPAPNAIWADPLTGALDRDRLVWVTNPPDRCALEAAVRLKEAAGGEATVRALSVGPTETELALRDALALGADSVERLWDPAVAEVDAWGVAVVLAAALAEEPPDLILCGDQSADWGSGQVGPALAELLDRPQVTGVTRLEWTPGAAELIVQRKLERGAREAIACRLPALLTVDATLNEPRYPSLAAHLASLRARIPVRDLSALGLSAAQARAQTPFPVELQPPRPRPKRLPTPPDDLPAFERIGAILSAGLAAKQGTVVAGSPEELADRLIALLRERGVGPFR